MVTSDDGSIPDDSYLLRRIHPEQVVDDENAGGKRVSSAAFNDFDLSVDSEHLLEANSLDWNFSLRDHPGYSLVKFLAREARAQSLEVIPDPISNHSTFKDNPYHCIVKGRKTRPINGKLRAASSWVHLAR